jgi:hypothetical protein
MPFLSPFFPICNLLPFFLVRFGGATACAPGIEWWWRGEDPWFTLDKAYFDSAKYSGSHNPYFRGSFIPTVSDQHTFRMEAHTYDTSVGWTPKVFFVFEGTEYAETDVTRTITVDLKKDFRYSFLGRLDQGFLWVNVGLWVSSPGTSEHVVDSTEGQICPTSGCENLDFSREYDCQPSPSSSPSPAGPPGHVFTPSFTWTRPPFLRPGLLMRSGFFLWVLWLPPSA